MTTPPLDGRLAAVFFDLDGTLCAPTVAFREVFSAVVAPVLQVRPELALADLLARWGDALAAPGTSTTAGCFRQVLAGCALAAEEGLAEELAVGLNAQWAASQALAAGAADVLRRLAMRWPLGLITNGPSDAQRAVVAALGLAPSFRWLLVSGDVDVGRRKPDPAIFDRAAKLAGCPSRALLYIGDSAVNDVAGAAAAGWRTCWLNPDGERPSAVPPPDLELRRLADLPAALGELWGM